MTNKLLITLALAVTTQANAAQLTVEQYFLLAQKSPVLTEAYTAGVLDATKNLFWCNQQDPKLEKVVKLALQRITSQSLDPQLPADFAIVPPLIALTPCQTKNK